MIRLRWDDQLEALTRDLRDAWEPRARLPVSELAERHLFLSREYTKEWGYIRFDRYPYLREPADLLGADEAPRVVVFKGPIQGGKTIIGQAFLVNIILQAPGPTLWVTDTDTKAEIFSKKRLDLMVRDDPELARLVADARGRSKDNTLHLKRFPGGDIKLVGAQSASGLTSDTCRYAIIDEADDHAANVSYAGSSVALAMNRQTTYGDLAKTLIVSSPKVRGDSIIEAWHARGDQRVWEVPCLRCGEHQDLRWRDEPDGEYRLVWDAGDPSSARYRCAYCGAEWAETDKSGFLGAGRWRATRPELGEGGTIASFGLNALYLPLGSTSWADLARQWESAMARVKAGDTDELRTFVNTRLGDTFEPPADAVDPRGLAAHESTWSDEALPERLRAITIGVDVQNERLEVEVVGWAAGMESWSLGYYVIHTDPIARETWAALDALRRRTWKTEDGRMMRAAATCVDSSFRTQQVMEYCAARQRQGERVFAVRGRVGRNLPVWDRKARHAGKKKNLGRFWAVGIDAAKDLIATWLRVTVPGPGYCHFQEGTPATQYAGLTAEHRVKHRSRSGVETWTWVKINEHAPNEPLDCRVYATAAVYYLLSAGAKLATDAPFVPPPSPSPVEQQTEQTDQPAAPTAPDAAEETQDAERDWTGTPQRHQPRGAAPPAPWFGRPRPRGPGKGWF